VTLTRIHINIAILQISMRTRPTVTFAAFARVFPPGWPRRMAFRLHPSARQDGYERFDGKKLSLSGPKPSQAKLAERWREFKDGKAILD
jgi:hypothetical protein